MALLLVVAVVALASTLGFVMLCSATLSNRAGGNQQRLIANDYLGESGINLALYYLQHPPSGDPQDYWTGANVTIVSAGSVNASAVRDATDPWTFEVTPTATAGTQSSTPIAGRYGRRIHVHTEFAA